MPLRIGIVGLPNVGKSTTFNALTKAQLAEVANYPFCTIQPNRAVVPVPDERVDRLAAILKVPNCIHATIEFVDIAGLVKGAHQGEGLGNQFLGQIRNTHAIVQVVRCFDDPNVVHISEKPDPRTDIGIINLELALADLEQLERKIEKLSSQVKGDKKLIPALELAHDMRDYLERGLPLRAYPHQDHPFFAAFVDEMRFLTSKPVIYLANVDETGLLEENEYLQQARQVAAEDQAEFVVVCAKLEEAILEMTPDEQEELLELAGAKSSGLDQVIQVGFAALNLISFFTKNENEVRAWNIPRGTTAPQAAGVIHTDFERGFIRAEVIPYETFVQYGSDAEVRAAGQMRLEGKEYVVQDGDIIFFRFNV